MRCTYALTHVIVSLQIVPNCVMYEALLNSEVSVRYVLALHHCCQMKIVKERQIQTFVCQRYVENRKKNLKSLPKIESYSR